MLVQQQISTPVAIAAMVVLGIVGGGVVGRARARARVAIAAILVIVWLIAAFFFAWRGLAGSSGGPATGPPPGTDMRRQYIPTAPAPAPGRR